MHTQPPQGEQPSTQADPSSAEQLKKTSGNGLLSNWRANSSQDLRKNIDSTPASTARPYQGVPGPATSLNPSSQGGFPGQGLSSTPQPPRPINPPSSGDVRGNTPHYAPTSTAGVNPAFQQPARPQQNPAYPGNPPSLSNGPAYPGNPPSLSNGPAYPGNPPSLSNGPAYPGNQPSLSNGPAYPGAPNAPAYSNAARNLSQPGLMNTANPSTYPPVMPPPNGPGRPMYPQQGNPNYSSRPPYYNGPPPNSPLPPNKRPTKRRFPIWARVIVSLVVFILVVSGATYAYYQMNYADSINAITGHQAIHHLPTTGNSSQNNQTTGNGGTLSGNRINILLLGSDNDGKGNDGISGSPLAQTDIVVTIDPQSHSVGMLSIPRDLQVTIPNVGAGKMDAAFSYGYQEANSSDIVKSTESAAGLTEDTIAYNFGIHIDYYAWVGLSGFVKVIDTADGVDIDAIHPMVDDVYPNDVNNGGDIYSYKRLYIAPGPQHMNGQQALEYVRTRHSDLIGDFGRSARQQQVLSQLKTKLATPDIIGKAPQLLSDLKGALETDLDLSKAIEMANYARGVNTNTIQRITLGPPTYAVPDTTDNSGNFFPVCSQVKVAIATMFAITPRCVPQYSQSSIVPTHTNTGVASVATPSSTPSATTGNAFVGNTTAWQALNQVTQRGTMANAASTDHFPAVHSLLDLMFMVVFESFDAISV